MDEVKLNKYLPDSLLKAGNMGAMLLVTRESDSLVLRSVGRRREIEDSVTQTSLYMLKDLLAITD